MRQGLPTLLFALAPCLMTPAVFAEATTPAIAPSVTDIESSLFEKHTDLTAVEKKLADKQNEVDNQAQQTARLTKLSAQAEQTLAKAKASLEQDYTRMIDEPDFDISPAQSLFQDAWKTVKEGKLAISDSEQKQQGLVMELEAIQAEKATAEASIATLNQDKLRARAERLRNEITQTEEQTVSFTNRCSSDMTLAQCSDQTVTLALQKAVKQFQHSLVDNATESNTVKEHLASASLNIHVLQHKVKSSGFSEDNRYRAVIAANLETRPDKNTPCRLLGIQSSNCFTQSEQQANDQQKEVAWVNLVVRSNQYNDKVSINGVNYGSTPVEIMLPTGQHMVTIEKEGYLSFHQELKIARDHNLRAVLQAKQNSLNVGTKFADPMGNDIQSPEMIVVGSGRYLLGENNAKQVTIKQPFALAATPTRVQDFKAFVESTGYQTDAELMNTCDTFVNAEITTVSDNDWQNPGFKQADNSPVVCVSQNDAKAYTRWLSKNTGFTYRLPTPQEWEAAARAGQDTNFWWGNEFRSGKANTGWAGTPWSNVSTSPVKSFLPTPTGFYDMVGNVWEWTTTQKGLAKGGAWSFSPEEAKVYNELYVPPSTAANYLGFRVVRDL
ncbi:formylglycine-generating enzyme family protein [Vibrio crassostreae]|uniref:Putative structural maintenance of chromosomes protein fused with sulphatase-modifying factor n=1 Tax=Vibrio crassostreae TaxID=246167 RepID=A0A822N0B4_9VIBR|nr:formylglycine-generating enzyme family protein [Vibrio crassostreae]MDH5949099.1 SUMF1/EgtB/PvdO family nonheme iron enzyme [Vibrio crassostreae]ROS69538.1 formylglycine-generating enzyme required for sulfatase activity [Vibrio crassostreae]RPF23851.1 formylglycine-generating enzyme required for sulfatase activity [Vibrio crassostreae]TCN11466.1 formylglycine-generating enzyme required for sulfatase activity [Vibrio crassostreae]TCT40084.1 formylglycine-generating enzyme required for sulfat